MDLAFGEIIPALKMNPKENRCRLHVGHLEWPILGVFKSFSRAENIKLPNLVRTHLRQPFQPPPYIQITSRPTVIICF